MEYTLTGPATTALGRPVEFTVELGVGNPGGTITITPAASPAVGTFAPATVALTNAARSKTFVYTPPASGPKPVTISVTNSGALDDPADHVLDVLATADSFSTVVKNPTAGRLTYSFLGPRGITLDPGETRTIAGNLFDSWRLRYNPRDQEDLVRALTTGSLEILSTPGLFLRDGLDGAIKVVDTLYNGTLAVSTSTHGAYVDA